MDPTIMAPAGSLYYGTERKRKRNEGNEDGGMTEEGPYLHKTLPSPVVEEGQTVPSPVVEIKDLAKGITESDLREQLQGFGTITAVHMFRRSLRQALVEYEDVTGSSSLVAYAAENPVYISGEPVSISYAKNERIFVPPSPVVYIKFEGERQVEEADIVSAMQMFGTISNVVMMESSHGALLSYVNMTESSNAVAYAAKNQVYICGQPVSINYSKDNKRILNHRPSRAVYMKFTSEQHLVAASGITKRDLVEAMQMFGTISNVGMRLDNCWAVVEYEDLTGSGKAVTYAAENPVYISGLPVSLTYSTKRLYEPKNEILPSPKVAVYIAGEMPVDDITEADVVAAMQWFGTISHVHMVLEKRQAFVEYEDMTGSTNAVTYADKKQVYVSGHPVSINHYRDMRRFSTTNFKPLPSPGVYIKFGGVKRLDHTMEANLVAAMQEFGTIRNVRMMLERRQAFVNYYDMTASVNVVTYAANNQVYISGHPVFISYAMDVPREENTPPSPVVCVKFGGAKQVDDTTEADLVAAMQEFGSIRHVSMMPEKHQAFVEYEDTIGSREAIAYAAQNPVYISGHPVFISYSMRGQNLLSTKHNMSPSPVVYVQFGGLMPVDDITEADVVAAMQEFGTIKHVRMMLERRQAFVAYDDMTGSANVVSYAAKNQMYISGQPAFINYGRTAVPSPVVHVLFRGERQVDDITEAGLGAAMQEFGTIRHVRMLLAKRQALVEYEDITGSGKAVAYAAENPVYISGHPVFIDFSRKGRSLGRTEDFTVPSLPSPVVYVKFGDKTQVDDSTEADLVAAMREFGTVKHVVMMPDKHQAFVEYVDGTGSEKAVTYAAKNPVYISGDPIYYINYSRHAQTLVSTRNYTQPLVYVQFGGKMHVDDITEADLVAAMQEFGTVSHVYMKPEKRQAIVEYDDMTGSTNAVTYSDKNHVYISGHPVCMSYSSDRRSIKIQTLPSPVVEIRDVVDGVTESKLVAALRGFGPIWHVLMIPEKRQAFVEYEDMTGSGNAVHYAAKNQVYVSGHPVSINYSKHKNVRPYNNVVEFTIKNPDYPITTEVLYTVCKKSGPVQRIVISRTEKAVEAMVEFDNVLSAQRAVVYLSESDNLQNYSGCSVLLVRILDANKPTRLNVFKNDQDTWDYTDPNRHNNNYESYGPPPHYEGRRMGPPMGVPPPHYEGRSMGPPMGVPPPHYEGHRMGPPMGVPPPEYGRHGDWSGRPWP